MTRFRYALALCICGAFAALSACGDQAEERQQRTPTPTASPTPTTAVSPSASIIRPDITPAPVVDLPPAPLVLTVGFPDGGAQLDPAAEQMLAHLLETEQFEEGWPIVLRGHSDSAGSDRANLDVSRRRAEAVATWFESNGVSKDRIRIIAFGEQNPVAPNALPDGTPNQKGRAKNRRVDIRIAPPASSAPTADSGETEESDGA